MQVIYSADALVGDFRKHQDSRIIFFCDGCHASKSYKPEPIFSRLQELRLAGYHTPIREVGRFTRMPCPKCAGTSWNTQLAFFPGLDAREENRLNKLRGYGS
jgi:hypothetical protein